MCISFASSHNTLLIINPNSSVNDKNYMFLVKEKQILDQ